VPAERTNLIKDIHTLLALEPARTPLERVEERLTAGYAHALALEAQQVRLQRRLWRLARELRDQQEFVAQEVVELSDLLAGVERELSSLRLLLVTLRDRARELRAA
jgi:muconolactone delta-isomerase